MPEGAPEVNVESPKSLTHQIKARTERSAYRKDTGIFWSIYGEPIGNYEKSFKENLNGASLKDFLVNRRDPVVIDLMGPSDTLANLFDKLNHQGILQRIKGLKSSGEQHMLRGLGISVNLEDRRSVEQVQRDNKLNIEQISGNVMESSAWDEVSRKLNGRKADLILERAAGGLDAIPIHSKYYAIVIQKIWNMLSSDGGMALLEVPDPESLRLNNVPIQEWVDSLKTQGINVSYIPKEKEAVIPYNGSLKIVRQPESSENLPLLE